MRASVFTQRADVSANTFAVGELVLDLGAVSPRGQLLRRTEAGFDLGEVPRGAGCGRW